MSKEKRIEEMRDMILAELAKAVEKGLVTWNEFADYLAERFVEQDYRKQSEGEWIKVAAYNDGILNTVKCSVCNTFMPIGDWDCHPYCPYCGAKMKGGEE